MGEVQQQGKGKAKGKSKGHKAKNKDPSLPIGQQTNESKSQNSSPGQDNKEKAIPQKRQAFSETEANEGQWLELADISPYDTWQVVSSSWDWNAEVVWEEAESPLPGLGDVSGLAVFIELDCHCPTPKGFNIRPLEPRERPII